MNLVERIKTLCESNAITITQLESAAGIARGTIGRWDKSTPSVDKVAKVAEYFSITIDELLGNEKAAQVKNLNGLDVALLKQLSELTPEESAIVSAFVAGMRANRKA